MLRALVARCSRATRLQLPSAAAAQEACTASTSGRGDHLGEQVQRCWTLQSQALRSLQSVASGDARQWLLQCSRSHAHTLQRHEQACRAAPWQLHLTRGLLGVPSKRKPVNYQDHNKVKPKRTKIKTPSVAKRRFIVDKDGMFWRMQAGRRHYRSRKSKSVLRSLKGLVPLAPHWARKLKKIGFKRRWWYNEKS